MVTHWDWDGSTLRTTAVHLKDKGYSSIKSVGLLRWTNTVIMLAGIKGIDGLQAAHLHWSHSAADWIRRQDFYIILQAARTINHYFYRKYSGYGRKIWWFLIHKANLVSGLYHISIGSIQECLCSPTWPNPVYFTLQAWLFSWSFSIILDTFSWLGLSVEWAAFVSPQNPLVSNLRLTRIWGHLPPAVEKVERLNTAAGIVDILGQGTFWMSPSFYFVCVYWWNSSPTYL